MLTALVSYEVDVETAADGTAHRTVKPVKT
jgi:hypothetical protein